MVKEGDNRHMKFCSNCSGPVRLSIPEGDDRLRHICDECGSVHYQNPKLIAGCVPVFGDSVLLCRRAIEPRLGFWTLPAGFMELGETVAEAAIREAREEAEVDVSLEKAYTLLSLPTLSQVYVFYLASMSSCRFAAGPESLEVRLFKEEEIPWDHLAFETVRVTLNHFFSDRKSGQYTFRELVLPLTLG